jgi:hypothetical protein
MNSIHIGNPMFGIILYKNALPRELNLVQRLESTIGNSTVPPYMWMDALVGDSQKMPEYRDCVDCKIGVDHLRHCPPQFSEITSKVLESPKFTRNQFNLNN